ncbi:MAG: HIT family protein [Myxococcales bacterium]|jgi:histidine triad (HIT) family protein|nr:MAG: HIT family protein [Myxococcales bacterium]
MSDPRSCIFCTIIAGNGDASVVHRDELVTAFMDIHPVNDGHTLIVPNIHSTGLENIDEATGGRMFNVACRIAAAMPSAGIRREGLNLFLADGAVAGQTVFHAHLHVLPRHSGDPFRVQIESLKRSAPARSVLDKQARVLADMLGSSTVR